MFARGRYTERLVRSNKEIKKWFSIEMKSQNKNNAGSECRGRNNRLRIVDTQPLLKALVQESQRRSHSLQQLAQYLGVDYRRLAQWRSDQTSIVRAHRSVFECAARYLQIPYALVLVLAGTIRLKDLSWPDEQVRLEHRIRSGIEQLRSDPVMGGTVPAELEHAHRDVRLFVLFLYDQMNGVADFEERPVRWLSALGEASTLLEELDTNPSTD